MRKRLSILFWVVGSLAIFTNLVLANNFNGWVECTNVVKADNQTKVATANKIEFVYYGTNGFINDPTPQSSQNAVFETTYVGGDDKCVNLLTNLQPQAEITNAVGDDYDTDKTYKNTAGKFKHKFEAGDLAAFSQIVASSSLFVYVRVWDGDPSLPGTTYGETPLFTPNIQPNAAAPGEPKPPIGPPNSTTFANNIKCVLTRAKPEPVGNLTASPINAANGQPPKIQLSFNRSIGARWYIIQYRENVAQAQWIFAGYLTNANHTADVTQSNVGYTITLPLNGDGKNYLIRVRAMNDYSVSADPWNELQGQITIDPTPDGTPPPAVSNLKVSALNGTTATLSWTAPKDLDKYGVGQNIASYVLRKANKPIVEAGEDNTVQTIWSSATAVDPAPAIPDALGANQTFDIANLSEPTFFAIKSSDGTSMSPISNIAAAVVGGGAQESVITLKPGLNFFSLGIKKNQATNAWYVGADAITKVSDLIAKIGVPKVSTFGFANQGKSGAISGVRYNLDVNGIPVPTETPQGFLNSLLNETQGYQVYLKGADDVTLTIKNQPS